MARTKRPRRTPPPDGNRLLDAAAALDAAVGRCSDPRLPRPPRRQGLCSSGRAGSDRGASAAAAAGVCTLAASRRGGAEDAPLPTTAAATSAAAAPAAAVATPPATEKLSAWLTEKGFDAEGLNAKIEAVLEKTS